MKYLNIICAASLFLAACTNNGTKTENKDADKPTDSTALKKATASTTDTSRCFLLTEGKSNQDSTTVELAIKDGKVTGQMAWLPHEKDKRKGTLDGAIKGDTINAVWSFMQEGMKDTIGLKFILSGNQLMQKPLKFDSKTGQEFTDDKAGYTLIYKETGKPKK